MIHIKIVINVLFFLVFDLSIACAQQSISSSGGNTSGAGGSVSYSIGQVAYISNTAISGSITQGVEQPYEISVISDIQEKEIALNIYVYPNPTSDFLILDVLDFNEQRLAYSLYELSGKLIVTDQLTNNQTCIVINSFPESIYFLKVVQDGKEVKIFKIIKRN